MFPVKGKSILIQVSRKAYEQEIPSCKDAEARLLPTSLHRSNAKQHPTTLAWYVVRDTTNRTGLEISEIFRGLKQDKPIHSRVQTGCVLLGSHLYEIGGSSPNRLTPLGHLSNKIRYLDTKNQDEGWKTKELPVFLAFEMQRGGVISKNNNSFYLFPYCSRLHEIPAPGERLRPPPRAFVYDTIEESITPLDLPKTKNFLKPLFCSEGVFGGILVAGMEEKKQEIEFFSLDYSDGWKKIEVLGPLHRLIGHPYAVSNNEILYIYESDARILKLHAYELSNMSYLGSMEVPHEFDNICVSEDGKSVFLVALEDSQLCFFWHTQGWDEEESPLYYAKVKVRVSDPWKVTLLCHGVLRINALYVESCLPY